MLQLDRGAVAAETGVAALALVLIPWAMFFDAFSPWEVVWLWAIWPFTLRYAVDRIMKLRAGYLAGVTESALVVPGLPKRVLVWDKLEAIDVRHVRFGPDDVVVRGGALPIVLDTQFSPDTVDEMVTWVITAVERHSPKH